MCKLLLNYTVKYYQYSYSRKFDALFVCFVVTVGKRSSLNEISANTALTWNELNTLVLLHQW